MCAVHGGRDLLWRRGIHEPILFLAGLVVIAVGLSVQAAVSLVGLTLGTDTSNLALGIQFGATAIALAFLTIGLLRRRRRTSAR
jgi:hypothetical protein